LGSFFEREVSMHRGLFNWCVLAIMVVSAWGTSLRAQVRPDIQPDAEAIAARCIEAVEQLTKRCVTANEETAKRCIEAIEKALEEGNEDRAKRLARRCIQLINRRTHLCLTRLGRHCRKCVAALERLEAFDLAQRVEAVCLDAAEKMRQSRKRTTDAIVDALGDIDPGPVPTPTDPIIVGSAG